MSQIGRTIGIVSIGQEPGFFSARYFREILTTVSQMAVEFGCLVKIISLTHEQGNNLAVAQVVLQRQQVDALLVVAPSERFLVSIGQMFDALPGIVFSPPYLDIPLSYVCSDNYSITRTIVRELHRRGRSRMLLLRPEILTGDYWERTRGYEAEIGALGLTKLIDQLPPMVTSDVVQQRVLLHQPDAVIAPSDNFALMLLSQFQRRNISVPEQIALVGFDDEDFAADTFPTLATIAQPITAMARQAIRYLYERLRGAQPILYQETFQNRLIVRESMGTV